MGLASTAVDYFAESAAQLTDGVPVLGNAAICVDSLCTSCRASINFYCAPSPVSKVFFGASCLCGVIGAGVLITALVTLTSFGGIPVLVRLVPEGSIVWVNINCRWGMLLVVKLQILQILLN